MRSKDYAGSPLCFCKSGTLTHHPICDVDYTLCLRKRIPHGKKVLLRGGKTDLDTHSMEAGNVRRHLHLNVANHRCC